MYICSNKTHPNKENPKAKCTQVHRPYLESLTLCLYNLLSALTCLLIKEQTLCGNPHPRSTSYLYSQNFLNPLPKKSLELHWMKNISGNITTPLLFNTNNIIRQQESCPDFTSKNSKVSPLELVHLQVQGFGFALIPTTSHIET